LRARAGTIGYEVLTSLGRRYRRITAPERASVLVLFLIVLCA
jgi:hypothetical protein